MCVCSQDRMNAIVYNVICVAMCICRTHRTSDAPCTHRISHMWRVAQHATRMSHTDRCVIRSTAYLKHLLPGEGRHLPGHHQRSHTHYGFASWHLDRITYGWFLQRSTWEAWHTHLQGVWREGVCRKDERQRVSQRMSESHSTLHCVECGTQKVVRFMRGAEHMLSSLDLAWPSMLQPQHHTLLSSTTTAEWFSPTPMGSITSMTAIAAVEQIVCLRWLQ